MEGSELGCEEGSELGCAEGSDDGCAEGSELGCEEGSDDGCAEGSDDGCAAGSEVGCAVSDVSESLFASAHASMRANGSIIIHFMRASFYCIGFGLWLCIFTDLFLSFSENKKASIFWR